MNRIEFMSRLSELLGDLPREEREEALQYYNDYLDDAGVESEQEVLEALGTPEQLAASIRGGMHEDSFFRGEFTENGFAGTDKSGAEEPPVTQETVKQKKAEKKDRNLAAGIFKVLCLICAMPIMFPIALAVLAILLSVIAVVAVMILTAAVTVAVVAIAIMIVGIVCVVTGIAAIVVAVAKLLIVPAGAAIAIGIGLCSVGIGVLLVMGAGALFCLLPAIFRGCVKGCSKLVHRKGGAA